MTDMTTATMDTGEPKRRRVDIWVAPEDWYGVAQAAGYVAPEYIVEGEDRDALLVYEYEVPGPDDLDQRIRGYLIDVIN